MPLDFIDYTFAVHKELGAMKKKFYKNRMIVIFPLADSHEKSHQY
jgi:hypothetical protein